MCQGGSYGLLAANRRACELLVRACVCAWRHANDGHWFVARSTKGAPKKTKRRRKNTCDASAVRSNVCSLRVEVGICIESEAEERARE